MFLEIANPRPNADGVLHTRISLFHAERHVKNNRAIRVDDNGVQSDSGAWLMFTDEARYVPNGRQDANSLLGRIAWSAALPQRMKTAAEHAADQRAIDLWPCIPRVSGRPLEDFLQDQARHGK